MTAFLAKRLIYRNADGFDTVFDAAGDVLKVFCATPFKSEILLLTTVLEAVLRILPMTLEMVTETGSPSLLPPMFVMVMVGSLTETELSLTATALISPSLTVSFLMTTFLPASADADEALAFQFPQFLLGCFGRVLLDIVLNVGNVVSG